MPCVKILLLVVNLLLFLCGVATAGVGIWTIRDPAILQDYINLNIGELSTVSYIITVVGFVLVIVGFIGCCGALLDNACFMCLFCIIMTVLVILGAAVAVVILVAMNNDTFGNKLKGLLIDQLEETELFNKLQKKVECCGIEGQTDYTDRGKGIPSSCKDSKDYTFQEGCWPKIEKTLKEKATILIAMSGTLAILAVISIVISVIFLCISRKAAKAI